MEPSPSDAQPSEAINRTVRRAPLAVVAACLCGGIIAGQYCTFSSGAWLAAVAVLIVFAAAGVIIRRKRLASVCLLAAFVAAGGLLHYRQYHYVSENHVERIIPADDGLFAKIRAEIVSEPFTVDKAPVLGADSEQAVLRPETAFDVRVSQLHTQSNGSQPVDGLVKVKLYAENPGLMRGDVVELTGKLQVPNRPTNPGQFDYREYLRRQGFRAVMYISGEGGVESAGPARNSLMRQVDIVRARLLAVLRESPFYDDSGILPAMLLGFRGELEPDTLQGFQRSGTMHLLAISGLHVGMIAGACVVLLRLVRVPMRTVNLLVIALVILYVVMSGARPPSVRAAVLIAFAMFGGVISRQQLSLNSVGAAALVILCFSPCELFAVGFQLSFAAFLSIVYFYEAIRDRLYRITRVPGKAFHDAKPPLALRIFSTARGFFVPLVAVSLAAYAGILPLLAQSFNIVSIAALFANVLLVPLAWLIVVCGLAGVMLATLLLPVFPEAGAFLLPANICARALDSASTFFGSLPFSHFYTSGPPVWFVAAYYLLLLAIINRKRLKITPRGLAIAGLLLVNLLALQSVIPKTAKAELTALDVWHGNCVLIEMASGKNMLYDCGTASNYFDVGEYLAAPLLWRKGVFSIDLVMLSHAHTDHVNGVISLLDRFRIGLLAVPRDFDNTWTGNYVLERFRERGVPVREVCAGEKITLGDDTIEIFNPPHRRPQFIAGDPNNESIVARLNIDGRRVLLCGDIEEPAIALLTARRSDIECDIMLLPHHGGYAENLDKLLDAAKPVIALASARFFPSDKVCEMLDERDIRLYATPLGGAISVNLKALRVKQHGQR